MTATLAGSAAILKTLYPSGEPPKEFYNKYPALAKIDKDTTFEGESKTTPLQTESTQGASADFATAQSNVTQSVYSKFIVTTVSDYSLARIDGKALKQAKTNKGAMVSLWENEMKSAWHTAMRSLAIQLYRNGTGSRARLATASSGVGTVTVTLAAPTDVTNFAVGMPIQGTNGDGGTLRGSGATVKVTAIDRANGTLTAAAAWSTTISGLTDGDYLLRAGDNNVVITGYSGWIAGGTAPGTLFGLNRNADPVRLAGQVYDATNAPMDEALIEAVARVTVEGGTPDIIKMHPRDGANLQKMLAGKIQYSRVDSAVAGIGFDAFDFQSDNGKVQVITDMNCPRYTAHVHQEDTWELFSAGSAPQILDFDQSKFLRVSNLDAYECRIGSYVQVRCTAPAWNIRLTNFGAP